MWALELVLPSGWKMNVKPGAPMSESQYFQARLNPVAKVCLVYVPAIISAGTSYTQAPLTDESPS